MDVLMSFSIRNVSGIFIATDDKREAMHIAYETNERIYRNGKRAGAGARAQEKLYRNNPFYFR